jgi:putative membrane protein
VNRRAINLSPAEADAVAARVAAVELRTGAQVVTAVVSRSHAYPQLPWKAFALAASLAGFAVVLADTLRPSWVSTTAVLLQTVAVLAAGGAAALLVIFVPPFARLFLRPPRRDFEVRRCAESLFMQHEVFATRERNGVLLLLSLFEHKVEILPDRGYAGRVTGADWQRVVAAMTPRLQDGHAADALLAGLAALEPMLGANGFAGGAGAANELPDRPIDTDGDAGGHA